jgi:hypothetical protein
LQFVSEGLGISLQVAWTPDFDQGKDLKIEARSRVNFVVSGAFQEACVHSNPWFILTLISRQRVRV